MWWWCTFHYIQSHAISSTASIFTTCQHYLRPGHECWRESLGGTRGGNESSPLFLLDELLRWTSSSVDRASLCGSFMRYWYWWYGWFETVIKMREMFSWEVEWKGTGTRGKICTVQMVPWRSSLLIFFLYKFHFFLNYWPFFHSLHWPWHEVKIYVDFIHALLSNQYSFN